MWRAPRVVSPRPAGHAASGPHDHVASVDVLRGLAVAAMIVVNNPGDWNAVFPPLTHAPWHGLHAADLVFPLFVVIVGVALPFSAARRISRSGRAGLLVHVARRSALLFAIGVGLNAADAYPHLDHLRIPGVLQRIALAYALAAPVVALCPMITWPLLLVGGLALHSWLLLAVPLPSLPAGTLTPAASLPGAVDAWVFGPAHLLTPTMDPEGLLGTIATAATMLGGALAGGWMRAAHEPVGRVRGLALAGLSVIAAAVAGRPWLPINKPLWTATFALASLGIALLLLAATSLVVDVWRWQRWSAPLRWLGVNPLVLYGLSELTRHLLDVAWFGRVAPKERFYWNVLVPALGSASPPVISLTFALGLTAIWIGVAGALTRRGVRIRI